MLIGCLIGALQSDVVPKLGCTGRASSTTHDGPEMSKGCLIEAYRFLGPKADPKRSLVLHSEAEADNHGTVP